MSEEAAELLVAASGENSKKQAATDQTLVGAFKHFFTRGHDGRVTCVDASAAADFIVSGGVDYTVRVWKYDINHSSYDLFATLEQTAPVPLPVRERTFFQKVWEIAFPKEIDWDDDIHKGRGITAVAPLSSNFSDGDSPFLTEDPRMRSGPIAIGNAHGDFYLLNLYGEEEVDEEGNSKTSIDASYKRLVKLHDGPINDLAVGAIYTADNSFGNHFEVVTSGEDCKCKVIAVECEEKTNPSFSKEHDVPSGLEAVSNFFFKGGGIPRAPREKELKKTRTSLSSAEMDDEEAMFEEEEEVEELEDEYVLSFVDMREIATLEHKAPVDCCRFVGDYGAKGPRWVSCTTAPEGEGKDADPDAVGVFLWGADGKMLTKLSMDVEVHRCLEKDKLGQYTMKAGKPKKSLSIKRVSAVWKKSGSLIFASTDGDQCGDYVAVWAIKDGAVGHLNADQTAISYKDEWSFFKSEASPPPVAIYEQPGDMLDVDKQNGATSFVTDMRSDFDIAMWNVEAAPPNMMLVYPDDPANLLIMPGRESVELVLSHPSKVIDTAVVEDSEGPALVVGCDDGALYAWDLSGHDKGQIYAEMRSLSPMEVFLPPLLLVVSALQMVSFAFGPAIPWKETVKQPAEVTHKVMMLDFKFTVKIDKAMIFWPEMIAILTLICMFLFSAYSGLPAIADSTCRSIQNSPSFKEEMNSGAGIMHLLLKIAKAFTSAVYLLMQLLSTALVVPVVQSIAESINCVRPPGTDWTEILLGNPNDTIYLASAPDVLCFQGHHTLLLVAIAVILPFYFYTLVPYAVCAGDAHYVPSTILFDYKVWEKDNTWWKAAERSATDLHLAFLHPNPREVFRTNLLELIAKILLPVVTILAAPTPLLEMSFVSAIGFVMWINAMLHPPYVERKMTVLVQDLKLFTMLTMMTGVLTVYLADPDSWIPIYCLVGGGVFVFLLLTFQMSLLQSARFDVKRAIVPKDDEEAEGAEPA
mmetsp:Transcript_49926/g.116558  ORF Transcript_49926/g.116558 Transcript_49926/m.116558 type:complete len:976 (+) Transcript_49926:55-2982(+)